MERGFDLDFLKANKFIKDRVEAQDWGTLAVPNRKANSSCVKEFFAEAAQTSKAKVKVRGRWVQYNAATINHVLGLKTPDSCAFASLMQITTEADEEEILAALVVEGKTWKMDGSRKCIPASSLTTEAAVWFQFLRHSLWPTTHDTTLSKDKYGLLFCIMKNLPIDLGHLMHAAIYQARTRKKVSLPLPCLITALLIDARVLTAVGDVWITSATTINDITIQRMGRMPLASGSKTAAGGPPVGTGGSRVSPRSAGPIGRGGGNLGEILEELKEIREQLQEAANHRRAVDHTFETYLCYVKERDTVLREFVEKKDPELAQKFPTFPPGICPEVGPEEDPFETPTH